MIGPAYRYHTLPEAEAIARIGTPVYGRFARRDEPGAELRGWRIEGEARPGAELEVTLVWHALARQDRDWTVFIHLVDANEQMAAEENRPPLGGAFPMTQWVAGDWIEDRHTLQLPPSLAPGTYTIRVGFYDPRDGDRRARMYDQRSKLRGEYVEIGTISVDF